MASTDYSQVAAYRAFVESISAEIFTKLYLGFRTANLVTHHEGVKGEKRWTEMQLKSLAKRYSAAFSATNTNDLVPEVLKVHACKVEHKEVPQEIEDTYLGFLRRNGFNHQEWPLERYTIMKLMDKLAEEMEIAVWQGDAAASPASTDLLAAVFDGYLKKIADAITATDVTPVSTGALDNTTSLAGLQAMYANVPAAVKAAGVDIMMSYKQFDNYLIDYKTTYNVAPAYVQIQGADYQGVRYELGGGNSTIIPVPGMGDSDRIIMHRRENFHLGYDSLADWGNFNFEQQVRELLYWMDFKVGTHITLLRDGIAVVNDAA
jgi:hypothetical protein